MQIFEDWLDRMQKISQVKPLLLPNLIKTGKKWNSFKNNQETKRG